MITSQQIALWADQLRDMSTTGLRHSASVYDTDRYREVQNISLEMLAAASGREPEELEPLRATIYARQSPVCAGGGAVIDDDGRTLLSGALTTAPGRCRVGAWKSAKRPRREPPRKSWM